jgi:hypothetical protein
MTNGESPNSGNLGNGGAGAQWGRAANVADISDIQTAYIMKNFPDAAIYPPPAQGGPLQFIYRRRNLLTRDRDLRRVVDVLTSVGAGAAERFETGKITHPIPGLAVVELPGGPIDPDAEARMLFSALETVQARLGSDVAKPVHLTHIAWPPPPATECPATEPEVPGDDTPQPAVSRSRCDGRGTLVAVVDTGLVEYAPASHPWLYGVTGDSDKQVHGTTSIDPYGGHGTFIASIIRALAPRAEVRVPRFFETAGALYEDDLVRSLLPVLDWAPDVISLSAGTHTWLDGGLLSFKVFVDGPLRAAGGTTLVAAAGNDGLDWKFAPAEMDGVIGVGALAPSGDARAWFSDFGDWVKVYAPGQDLVHAFASGQYTYVETNVGQVADFTGMARWSGTSFSTPVVSGLIAARMSGTGESSREAAESLLRLARAQALPGVGPVLRPGQACLCACEPPCREPRAGCGCRPAPDR